MPDQPSPLDQIAIILMEPKFPENIGAAARIAWNMGLSRLIVVRDEFPEYEPMAQMATHKAVHLIDNMEFYHDLGEALSPFSLVVATTARKGRQRPVERTPRDVANEVAPLLAKNHIAFLFGPENRGLTNDDLRYCQMTSTIPSAGFSSLNLAQAIAVHCYELRYTLIHEPKNIQPSPQYASSFELEGMYSHVEKALLKVDFLQEKTKTYWMNNIRQFLSRIKLTSKESNIIRGICRQFLWYQSTQKQTKDSLKNVHNELEDQVRSRTQELEAMNSALKVLLDKREIDKLELEDNILSNVKTLVQPYIERLKQSGTYEPQRTLVDILESNLNEIVAPFSRTLSSKLLNLTPAEIQVSHLVKQGKTSKEIAEILSVSERTIAFHRENIRKKLGIKHKKTNLQTYLYSID